MIPFIDIKYSITRRRYSRPGIDYQRPVEFRKKGKISVITAVEVKVECAGGGGMWKTKGRQLADAVRQKVSSQLSSTFSSSRERPLTFGLYLFYSSDLTPRPASLATTGCLHASDLQDNVPSLPWIPSVEYYYISTFLSKYIYMHEDLVSMYCRSLGFLNLFPEGHKSFKSWSIFE